MTCFCMCVSIVSSQVSTSSSHTRGTSPISSDGSPHTTDGDTSITSADISKKAKGWHHFHPLHRMKKSHSDTSFSPVLKSTYQKQKGESLVEKADKVYNITAGDASMLERLSQRAQDNALRMQKHHDVSGLNKEGKG